jgi:hypothetical protein
VFGKRLTTNANAKNNRPNLFLHRRLSAGRHPSDQSRFSVGQDGGAHAFFSRWTQQLTIIELKEEPADDTLAPLRAIPLPAA